MYLIKYSVSASAELQVLVLVLQTSVFGASWIKVFAGGFRSLEIFSCVAVFSASGPTEGDAAAAAAASLCTQAAVMEF